MNQFVSKNKFLVLNIAIIILIIGIASILILFRLGGNSLQDWDEAIYAQVSREMVSSGDWLTPHYNFQPWFEKPPLMMWVTAALFSIFKVNEFWSRAASAFSGILLVLATYLIGKKAFNIRVGILAAITLLSTYDFLYQSRNGTTDMMLSLFIYLSVLTYLYARKDKRYWYGIGTFFSFAFMTKFWAAGVIPLILLITLILDAKLKETIHSKYFWGSVLLSLAIIIPWHLSMLLLHFKAFIDRYLIFDLLNRSTRRLEGNGGNPIYYFNWLMDIFSPWIILVPIGLLISLRNLIKKEHKTNPPILIILVFVIFFLYSFLIQTKLPWYIVPIYPAFALLISCVIIQAFDSYKSFAFIGLIGSLFVALFPIFFRHRPKLSILVLFLFFMLLLWVILELKENG
jgi:4-amino-4-deoxy-L-arabinose transferase-like glycosyltransferase